MSTSDVFDLGCALADQIKAFKAKERDHLMRLAYLGAAQDYAESDVFLSGPLEETLRPHAEDMGADSPRCVFATMDFHIDWICAAMMSPIEGRAPASPSVPLLTPIEVGQKRWNDFRPDIGTHDDVGLLVAFANKSNVAVLFIEVKGELSFDRPQLTRKILRLDSIVTVARERFKADRVRFRLLAAPQCPSFCKDPQGEPGAFSCIHCLTSKGWGSLKLEQMRQAIGAMPHLTELGASVCVVLRKTNQAWLEASSLRGANSLETELASKRSARRVNRHHAARHALARCLRARLSQFCFDVGDAKRRQHFVP